MKARPWIRNKTARNRRSQKECKRHLRSSRFLTGRSRNSGSIMSSAPHRHQRIRRAAVASISQCSIGFTASRSRQKLFDTYQIVPYRLHQPAGGAKTVAPRRACGLAFVVSVRSGRIGNRVARHFPNHFQPPHKSACLTSVRMRSGLQPLSTCQSPVAIAGGFFPHGTRSWTECS